MLPLTPAAPLRAVTGLLITLLAEGNWVATYCQLRRRGQAVTVQSMAGNFTSLAALREALPANPTPLALILAGRGVLYRSLPLTGGSSSTLADKVTATLPGAVAGDFYVQHETAATCERLSLVRRSVVDSLVQELRTAGLWVVDLSFGPSRFTTLLPYLPQLTGQLAVTVGDFQLSLDASPAVTDLGVRPADEPVPCLQIGADTIPGQAVLPYAAALTTLLKPSIQPGLGLEVVQVKQLRAEWWHRQLFRILRLSVPGSFLLVLLGNFLLAQQLSSARANLVVDLDHSRAVLDKLQNLQQSATQKRTFLTATGWSHPSWNSLCADRLAASLPVGVQLLSLEISPVQPAAGSSENHQPAFRNGVVLVKGQCRDAQRLNIWLQKVSELTWVRAVRDQNFAYDYAGGVGTFTFTLEISPAVLFL